MGPWLFPKELDKIIENTQKTLKRHLKNDKPKPGTPKDFAFDPQVVLHWYRNDVRSAKVTWAVARLSGAGAVSGANVGANVGEFLVGMDELETGWLLDWGGLSSE